MKIPEDDSITTKVKSKAVEIQETDRPHGENIWSKPLKIIYNKGSYPKVMYLQGVICGCGLGQLKGVIEFNKKELEEIIPVIKNYCKHSPQYFTSGSSGIGAIIAALGSMYYSSNHDKLIAVGFKQVSEFKNLAHASSNHTQRVYILEID